jgi:hypothetical protein
MRLAPVGEPRGTLHAGDRVWTVPVEGLAPGVVGVALESDGLPALHVPVEVVPRRVFLEDGTLVLQGLDGTREGTIELTAPEDVVFTQLSIPEPASDFLAIDGLGTGCITLTFIASPDVPAVLSLPVTLEGLEPGGRVAVYDCIHENPLTRCEYLIPVR